VTDTHSVSSTPSLADYQRQLLGKTCIGCREPELGGLTIEHYQHEGGWCVAGFIDRQWLSVECPRCGYCISLWKLGIAGKATAAEQAHEEGRLGIKREPNFISSTLFA